jgi:hypothetical protein
MADGIAEPPPTNRVVAVFGPSKRKRGPAVPPRILNCARDLGAALVEANQIVLTGGDGRNECSVKDAAIRGAGKRAWVGVLQDSDGRADPPGHVIRTGMGEKRNFLEAVLCHVAIALYSEGGGTLSELGCAFSLQRPVALVGDGWLATQDSLDFDLPIFDATGAPSDSVAAKALMTHAAAFLARGPMVGEPFENRITTVVDPENAKKLLEEVKRARDPQFRHFGLPAGRAEIDAIVAWVAGVPLPAGSPATDFPEIEHLEQARVDYVEWLASIPHRVEHE